MESEHYLEIICGESRMMVKKGEYAIDRNLKGSETWRLQISGHNFFCSQTVAERIYEDLKNGKQTINFADYKECPPETEYLAVWLNGKKVLWASKGEAVQIDSPRPERLEQVLGGLREIVLGQMATQTGLGISQYSPIKSSQKQD